MPAAAVRIGDKLLILPGDLVPCDGVVLDGESELDTSSLTGEAVPLRATRETRVMSGMANGFGSFRMIALAPAEPVNTRESSSSCVERRRASLRFSGSPIGTPCGSRRSRWRSAASRCG